MDGAGSPTTFDRAESLFAAGRLDEAAEAYRIALDEAGPHPDTFNRLGMIAAKRNDHAQALTMLRRACEADGWRSPAHRRNMVTILLDMATARTDAADYDGAISVLMEAAGHVREFPVLRARVADALCDAACEYVHAIPSKAVMPIRAAIRLAPERATVRDLWGRALSRSGTAAELADFTGDLRADQLAIRPFVACFPESGSTRLKTLLCRATGYPEHLLAYSRQRHDQALYLPYVLQTARTPCVSRLHCRATEPDLHIMQAFGLRPVVLVRNIYDVLLRHKEACDAGAPVGASVRGYHELDEESRMDLIVDDRAPWCLAFYASWHDAVARGRIDAYWLTHEKLGTNGRDVLASVLAFYGLPADGGRLDAAFAADDGNRWDTDAPRGGFPRAVDAFSERHKARIARFARYYPSIDFSLIGL